MGGDIKNAGAVGALFAALAISWAIASVSAEDLMSLPSGSLSSAVRVLAHQPPYTNHGSGVIVAANGQTALVLTVRHALEGTSSAEVYRQNGHGYHALILGVDRDADLGALLIRDTGDLHPAQLARSQAMRGTFAGYGGNGLATASGPAVARSTEGSIFYSFVPRDGDSGAPVFDPAGRLTGIVWGRSGEQGAAVSVADLHRFLASLTITSYHSEHVLGRGMRSVIQYGTETVVARNGGGSLYPSTNVDAYGQFTNVHACTH